jgi:hypothetical protein
LKTFTSVVPPTGGGVPEPTSHVHHERSGSGKTPKAQSPPPIYSTKLFLFISPNLLAIDPFKAYVDAKRAAKTQSDVTCFIVYVYVCL